MSLASSEVNDGEVHLTWSAPAYPGATRSLQRQASGGAWLPLGDQVSDASGDVTFNDRTVQAGVIYSYRTRGVIAGVEVLSAVVTVSVPALSFALDGIRPNPLRKGDLTVTFTLQASAPARLELIDVTGRLVEAQPLGVMGVGRHTVKMASAGTLAAGINFIRLTQGVRRIVTPVVVVP